MLAAAGFYATFIEFLQKLQQPALFYSQSGFVRQGQGTLILGRQLYIRLHFIRAGLRNRWIRAAFAFLFTDSMYNK